MGLLFDYLIPECVARMDSIELEGKCPSLWILIIVLKDIDPSYVLPLIDWLFNGGDVQKGKKSGLTCPEVALDGDDA
jgi:hypothetical protein